MEGGYRDGGYRMDRDRSPPRGDWRREGPPHYRYNDGPPPPREYYGPRREMHGHPDDMRHGSRGPPFIGGGGRGDERNSGRYRERNREPQGNRGGQRDRR